MRGCICDFCSAPDVAWCYPAHTFAAYVVEGIMGESIGDWAACPKCHALIESGCFAELAERSLRTLLEKQPDMRPAEAELRTHIQVFHTMPSRCWTAYAAWRERDHDDLVLAMALACWKARDLWPFFNSGQERTPSPPP